MPVPLTILLFASLREALGDSIELQVNEPMTVTGVLDALVAAHPQYAALRRSLRVAVDLEYAEAHQPIQPGQEVAILPPVGGG